MSAPQHLSLYLDHPKVGCGWRAYLVLKEGRKHARILCTETAEAFTVPVLTLKSGRPMPLKPSRCARRLRDTARAYGMEKTSAVRDALRLLKVRT